MQVVTAIDGHSRRRFGGREWLLLVVILALATSLTTRYVHVSSVESVPTLKSDSPEAQHQRLHKNTFQWTARTDEFAILVSAVFSHHPAPLQPLLIVHLDDSLYNRPPPSC